MTGIVRRSIAIPLLCTLVLALSAAARADGDAARDHAARPKIGLALSGGGAKGCAHVGVLRVLERHNIPVDYIAGTSMGAVIGGLYAAGYDADQLETFLTTADWIDLMVDEPKRTQKSFRRKEEDRLYLFDIELGQQGWKLKMPRGYRQGRKFTNLLREWTLPVAGVRSFDKLPIPFRAVATDIARGEMVVLEDGDLVQAIRASMAIPGAIAPVMRRGILLVDGGTTLNVPVEVVRAMGADIVIAVDISEGYKPVEELDSSIAITNQLINMITRENMEKSLPGADLVLLPAVKGTGTLDFSDVPGLIAAGEAEALRVLPRMEGLDLPLPGEAYRGFRAGQQAPPFVPPMVTSVRVEGQQRVDQRTLLSRIDMRPGAYLDLDVLHNDLARIYGLGYFQMVDFSLEPAKDGVAVVISVREKEWGPNYVRFGLNFQIDENRGTTFGFNVLHNVTMINRRGAELRSLLTIGQEGSINTEFYQPLDYAGRFFVSPGLALSSRPVDAYVDGHKIAEFDEDVAMGAFDVGMNIGRSTELRAGLYYGAARLSLDTGSPELFSSGDDSSSPVYDEDLSLGGLHAEARLDRLDRVTFPRHGYMAMAEYFLSREEVGADDDYQRLGGGVSTFFSRGRHTLFVTFEGGTSLGSPVPLYHQFTLGGLFSLAGYHDQELRGRYSGVGQIGYYASLWPLPSSLGQNVYFGGWIEAGNVWNDSSDIALDDLRETLALLVGADTVVGPIYLAWGLAEDDRSKLYLSIGRGF